LRRGRWRRPRSAGMRGIQVRTVVVCGALLPARKGTSCARANVLLAAAQTIVFFKAKRRRLCAACGALSTPRTPDPLIDEPGSERAVGPDGLHTSSTGRGTPCTAPRIGPRPTQWARAQASSPARRPRPVSAPGPRDCVGRQPGISSRPSRANAAPFDAAPFDAAPEVATPAPPAPPWRRGLTDPACAPAPRAATRRCAAPRRAA
jgi:hypothetical protein